MGLAATYVSGTSFTVATDLTLDFHAGRRVKTDCGVDGLQYGTIASSSYGAPNTTVILDAGSDTLTVNLTEVWYGIVGKDGTHSLPVHDHTTTDGEGGLIAVNTLDDYKEGTWTPVPADAATGGNTGSAATALGTYTKVGRQVTVTCRLLTINTTGLTANNSFYIQGLPFATQTATNVSYFGGVLVANVAFTGSVTAIIPNGAQSAALVNIASGGSPLILVSGVTDDAGNIFFTITYEV